MSKRDKIIYWIATAWLSLGMVSTGIVQIMHQPKDVEMLAAIGYPAYLLTLIGIWKILGVIAILVPRFPLVKEWAYAGFFFCMSGAIYSHMVAGQGFSDIWPPLLLLVLTVISWYFRPANRKLTTVNA
ncbi:DoxX-like family protein [Chitinophaga jiangningensis]|uniref:DoxX-like family protein n=1 Tax=Chitinophaga jiangningensis TaxID=1419482 RepID=A0A1M7LPY7_9BACT|nr:DoxX family protein [Chitinophaga jiangningensis]SHM80246.1 DoxX-like family protein [Chitinophaga jiangningensis]